MVTCVFALFSLEVPLPAASTPDAIALRVDDLFTSVTPGKTPGAAVAVVRNGRAVLTRYWGMADDCCRSRHWSELCEAGHRGGITGFYTYIARLLEQGFAVIVLPNTGMQPPRPIPAAGDWRTMSLTCPPSCFATSATR